MSIPLEIPVTYKNQQLLFKGHVVRFGYVQHIIVDVYGNKITIERDEEGNYRALTEPEGVQGNAVDVELLREVLGVLQRL
jgi:hypothetical protein